MVFLGDDLVRGKMVTFLVARSPVGLASYASGSGFGARWLQANVILGCGPRAGGRGSRLGHQWGLGRDCVEVRCAGFAAGSGCRSASRVVEFGLVSD